MINPAVYQLMRTAGWLPFVSFIYICFPALWRSLMKHRILHESASLLLEYDVPKGYIHAIRARDQTPGLKIKRWFIQWTM